MAGMTGRSNNQANEQEREHACMRETQHAIRLVATRAGLRVLATCSVVVKGSPVLVKIRITLETLDRPAPPHPLPKSRARLYSHRLTSTQ
jgi:hypothetical protein